MKISELIFEGEYTSDSEVKNITVERVISSTKDIRTDDLFVLIKGINFDTEKIIDYIISKSPRVIVCDADRIIRTDIPIIRVKDARAMLSHLLSRYYNIDYERMRFVGVTGTNGKTTTATMIKTILERSGAKCGFIGTGIIEIADERINRQHYSMTTPDPEELYPLIKKMELEGCDTVIMEISSHSLALGKVAPIPFLCSVFTNLSEEHLDFHRGMDDYYRTKLSLFSQSKNGVFNADDEYSSRAMNELSGTCKTYSVGVLWDADVMARDVNLKGFSGSSYIYREANLIFKVYLNMPGTYNIYNSLLAIKCALVLGVSAKAARDAIKELSGVEGRFETINGPVMVIIDYAHTEKAFENLLKTVNSFKNTGQNIITVFGCGGERDRTKRPKMARAAERYSDFTIVTSDNPRGEEERDIIADILSGFERTERRKVVSSRTAAISGAILSAKDGDIVVILGKGHEKYTIDKNGYHDFDERKIVESAMTKRKGKEAYAHESD